MNGFGNIGRRLANTFSGDKEIQFIGVAKYRADEKTREALESKYDVYVPEHNLKQFSDNKYKVSGTVQEAVKQSDIIVDAAKEGEGVTFDGKVGLVTDGFELIDGKADIHLDDAVALSAGQVMMVIVSTETVVMATIGKLNAIQ